MVTGTLPLYIIPNLINSFYSTGQTVSDMIVLLKLSGLVDDSDTNPRFLLTVDYSSTKKNSYILVSYSAAEMSTYSSEFKTYASVLSYKNLISLNSRIQN
jgi:hypothetical protein